MSGYCSLALSAESEPPSLSYSFFGIGQERPIYSESLDNFGGQKFESEFESTGLMQVSGGYTQINKQWGFEIITSSTLLADETQEEWNFTNYGTVQTDNTTLSQSTLVINGVHFPFNDNHKLTFGIRYQKIAFSRFDFKGTDNTAALNTALLANDAEYNRLVDVINNFVGDPSNGIPDPANGNALLVDDSDRLITSVDELTAARGLDPETQQGVIFEDASSLVVSAGYGLDTYFTQPEQGVRWRAGAQVGIPLFLSVLNTNNNITLSENLPSGFDVSGYAGIGYQFSKEIGVILQADYVYSERDKLQEGNIYLPKNEYQSLQITSQIFWAF
jgi:hypothetical protein